MRSQNSNGSHGTGEVITDPTKWQHVDPARERAIRALRMTNACADAIIRATDEATMLAGACQAMVAIGGYKSAWVGATGNVPAESFCPLARAARTGEHDDNLGVVSRTTDGDHETSGSVLCPLHIFVLRDGDGQKPQGCAAREADHRPRVTVPLQTKDEFYGCWVLRSDEPDAFQKEELALLATLADDLAFGLAAQRNKQARSRLAAIVESAGDAIIGRDLQGTVTTWNHAAARLLGYGADEIIGRHLGILCPPELTGESDRLLAKVQCGETVENYDTVRLDNNGRRIPVSLTYSPIRDEMGRIVGAAVFGRDCTARKAAEEAVRFQERQRDNLIQNLAEARDQADQANQAKSRFLASVTHELRTPLHGMLGYAELLTLEGDLNPTQLGRLAAMMNAGHGLLGTINAVLDMSRTEADQIELHPDGFDLPDLVRGCLEVVRPVADAKGLALIPPRTAPLRIFADATRVRQVLVNLLGNAVKFTPAGSVEVRLRATDAGASVRLEVADTGPGVWPRHRDKLFIAFERLNAEAVSGIEGTGLGLAIAERLVRLMGGRIGYADNPGGGSVFWVELPRGSAPPVKSEGASPPPLGGPPRLRVLVADDESLNRDIATRFLSIAGHDVRCVDNGAAAVEAAATGAFDVILMDVRMPGMNGLEATRLIRALPAPRGAVPVVAVTAQAFVEQIETCRRAGMDWHVPKPFTQSVLLAALGRVMLTRNATEPAALPADAAPDEAASALPVLDSGAFAEIARTLSAADLDKNLLILIGRCETLLDGLRQPGMTSPASERADLAHTLAGGAGTFGFLSVSAAARAFERAIESNAADADALAQRLSATIEASLPTMRACVGRSIAD